MQPELQILLLLLFAVNSFVGLLHFIKHPKSQSNTYLGIFIVLFGMSVLHILAVNVLFLTKYNSIILLPLNLVFFPFFFLLRYFDKFLSFRVFSKTFENTILFIAIIELSANLLPTGAWIYTGSFDENMVSFVFDIKRIFVFLLLPFGFYTLWHLNRGSQSYNLVTNDDKIRYSWIREIIIATSLLILIVATPEFAGTLKYKSLMLFILQAVVGTILVVYIGLRNLNIQFSAAIESAREINSYNSHINLYFKNILQLMKDEKLYQNTELRISDIAQRISLSPNYVSRIVNESAKMNFNDFVNQFRVNEVMEKLRNKEYQKKSIFTLAQEAGFKSRSTFHTVFKKATGKTPTQYIKEFEIQK